ncbi:minor capsid protein [Lacticaseibacillus paracasei]|nr:minor capsid protein [Lacticaseibacillus paracasei]MCO7166445.1 minor capsid protein [Lacticaseibacillus paracasei]
MTNSSVGFPQFYQIQQILDRFLDFLSNNCRALHIPQSGDRIDDNLATPMNQMLSRIHTLTTNEAIRNSNSGKNRAYDEQNVQYVMWLTEEDDRVCDICEPLDRQTFAYGQAPIPVTDTHPRCRCQLVACDEDGNLLSGELDSVFKETDLQFKCNKLVK